MAFRDNNDIPRQWHSEATMTFRDNNDISVSLLKLHSEAEIFYKNASCWKEFLYRFVDVARTRQYGGIASRIICVNPLKTYTELDLNFRFLPKSKHIPSGLWKPLSGSCAEKLFFQSHAEHISAFNRHEVYIGHVKNIGRIGNVT